jgi:Ca-activated chloride channel family protein
MELRFLAPGFLLLLALALVPWIGPFAARDRRHAALRSIVLVLIALALARPVRVVRGDAQHEVVILDRSASVTEAADRSATDALRAHLAEPRDERTMRTTVIELGGDAASTRRPLELPRRVAHVVFGAEHVTLLGPALAAAARAIPPGAAGRVIVHTDGLATEPLDTSAAAHALADLAARGIPVVLRPLAGAAGDLRPVALEPSGVLRAGLATTLTARIVGGGQVVTCRLLGSDTAGETPGGEASFFEQELDRVEGVLVDGEARVSLTFEPPAGGFVRVALELELTDGVDPRPGDTRLERTLAVQDPLRVLYLGERITGGGAALSALVGAGFELTPSAEGAPLDVEALDSADLVVLDDRPAASVPEPFQRALADAVSDRGLGLVAAGGEAAFGPGGYHEQPLEQLLPVEFVQKEEKRDPSTTLVVIIDTSGSMGGQRVQLAKEVARLAIRRLLPHDKVGMVEFYGAKRWAVPIQPASNSIEIERALNRLDAGGGTVILPAIEEAYYGLKNVRTRFKHVLILTDGGVETGAFEPLLRRMADEGINVSTVLIGGDAHSEFLVTLSNWGQGRFYSVPNRFNLPEILLKQPASAKLPAYRAGLASVRVRGGEAWFGDLAQDPLGARSLPPVAGYVETRARPGAERVIETSAEAHPILASWRYGLGRVTALTTEPTGPGSAPWREDGDYGAWLARALERTAADTLAPFVYTLVRVGGEALLVAERRAPEWDAATDDTPGELAPRAELVPFARATEDASRHAPWGFERVAADRHEARLPLAATDGLAVVCRAHAASDTGAIAVGPSTRLALEPLAGAAAERQVQPEASQSFAAALARSDAAAKANAQRADTHGVERLREYRHWLAILALLTYLADIAYRRWPRRAVSFV